MTRQSRILLAMVLAIAGAPAARAGYVTPDSIGAPVISSSVTDSTIAPGSLVTDQYEGSGVRFSVPGLAGPDLVYGATVIRLNNRDVFAGAFQSGATYAPPPFVSFTSPAGVGASFVLPGTTTPDVADSVTTTLYSKGPILAQLEAFDKNGQLLKTITTQVGSEIDTPIEIDAAGIQSIYALAFQATIDPLPGFPDPPTYPDYPYAWGVSSIEWHDAPEPAGFVLGGLGVIALLAYAWRRRPIRVHLG